MPLYDRTAGSKLVHGPIIWYKVTGIWSGSGPRPIWSGPEFFRDLGKRIDPPIFVQKFWTKDRTT